MPKKVFNSDEIARSFVMAFLKNAEKELTIQKLIQTATALKENDIYGRTFPDQRAEALTPEKIKSAARTLVQWNQIAMVSPDVYCLPQFMPKYRTLDDTWLS